MDDLPGLHGHMLEDSAAAVDLLDLDGGRSTQHATDGPLPPEDLFAAASALLPDDAESLHPVSWPHGFPGTVQVRASQASQAHGPLGVSQDATHAWPGHHKPLHLHLSASPVHLEPAAPAYYRTASWPVTHLPQPSMLTALSVPPPPSPGPLNNPRRASLPLAEPWSGAALVDRSTHGSDHGSLYDGDDGSTHGTAPTHHSSDADTPKVPLSNIAAMMTGINMASDKASAKVGLIHNRAPPCCKYTQEVKGAKGPLKDPPRSRGTTSKGARERMLQQNRMAQAKYRERQKERAMHMATELATKRQQNASLVAALEERDATIAMLRAQLASAEGALRNGSAGLELTHAHSNLVSVRDNGGVDATNCRRCECPLHVPPPGADASATRARLAKPVGSYRCWWRQPPSPLPARAAAGPGVPRGGLCQGGACGGHCADAVLSAAHHAGVGHGVCTTMAIAQHHSIGMRCRLATSRPCSRWRRVLCCVPGRL